MEYCKASKIESANIICYVSVMYDPRKCNVQFRRVMYKIAEDSSFKLYDVQTWHVAYIDGYPMSGFWVSDTRTHYDTEYNHR